MEIFEAIEQHIQKNATNIGMESTETNQPETGDTEIRNQIKSQDTSEEEHENEKPVESIVHDPYT